MLSGVFGLPHLLILLVIVLLVFGGAKLPAVSRGLVHAVRAFRSEVSSSGRSSHDSTKRAGSAAGSRAADAESAAEVHPIDPAPRA